MSAARAVAIALVVVVAGGVASAQQASVVTPVLLRERADERSPIVARVKAGTTVTLVGRGVDGTWLQVRAGGRTGWAHKGFFKVATATAPTAADATSDNTPSLVAPRGTSAPSPQPRDVPAEKRAEGWRRHDDPSSSDARAEPEPSPPPAREEVALSMRPALPDRRNLVDLVVDGGVAAMSRRYVSNGTGPMAAYELSTMAVVTGAAARYLRRVGSHGAFGADLAYAYASGGSVRYTSDAGAAVKLHLQEHDAEGALRLALYSPVAGGIELTVRVGALLTVTIFDPDVTVRLQSDRLIAPVAGLAVDAPHLMTLGGHWLGVALSGRAVLDGRLAENLDEGSDRGTWGGRFGGRLTLELVRTRARGQLVLGGGYTYAFTVSRFAGPSQRDPSSTQATLGSAAHVATLALGYAY